MIDISARLKASGQLHFVSKMIEIIFKQAKHLTLKFLLSELNKDELANLLALPYNEVIERHHAIRDINPTPAILEYILVELYLDSNGSRVNGLMTRHRQIETELEKITDTVERNAVKLTKLTQLNRFYLSQLNTQ